MTAAADKAVTARVNSPVVVAPCDSVVVSILALDVEELADHTRVDDLLRSDENGVAAADLTDHKELVTFLGNLYHTLAFLHRQSHRLLAENVLACAQKRLGHLEVVVVGNDEDGNVDLRVVEKLAVVVAGLLGGKFLKSRVYLLLCGVADRVEVLLAVEDAFHMCSAHPRAAYDGVIKYFVRHRLTISFVFY